MSAGNDWEGIWIGLADVVPINTEAPVSGAGAYVNVLSLARDEPSFRDVEGDAVLRIHLSLVSLEHIERFDLRLASHSVDREVMNAAAQARALGKPAFATFHNYPALDA